MKLAMFLYTTLIILILTQVSHAGNQTYTLTITATKPGNSGILVVLDNPTNPKSYIICEVPVLTGETPVAVAKKLAEEFNKQILEGKKYDATKYKAIFTTDGKVIITNTTEIAATRVYASISAPSPKTSFVAVNSNNDILSGINDEGFESTFITKLGFDGMTAEASLLFSNLSGNTIDDLLTDTYNELLADLPTSYMDNLSLDLNRNLLEFAYPSSTAEGFIEIFMTDKNIESRISIESAPVPEPTTLSLFLTGATAIILFGMRKFRA